MAPRSWFRPRFGPSLGIARDHPVVPEHVARCGIKGRDRAGRGAALVARVSGCRHLQGRDGNEESSIVEGRAARPVGHGVPSDPVLPEQRAALQVDRVGTGARVHEKRGRAALRSRPDHDGAADRCVRLESPPHAPGGQVQRHHLSEGTGHEGGVSGDRGGGAHVGASRKGESPAQLEAGHVGRGSARPAPAAGSRSPPGCLRSPSRRRRQDPCRSRSSPVQKVDSGTRPPS